MRETIKKLTPKFLIRIYQLARYLGITALFFVCRIFPIKKNLVVLCNVWGYGDNAKYVGEELCRRMGKNKKMELVFVTNHPEQVPKNLPIRALKTNSPSAISAREFGLRITARKPILKSVANSTISSSGTGESR